MTFLRSPPSWRQRTHEQRDPNLWPFFCLKKFNSRCQHCQELAPVWEKLAEEWKDHPVGLIAEVDCTDEDSHNLCEEMEVDQYPTLLYGDPFEASQYEGSLELEDLSAFAKENLVTATCSPANLEACDEETQRFIVTLHEKEVEELEELEEKAARLLHEAHLEYEDEIERLQSMRETLDSKHQEKLDAIHQEYNYKYLRQVLSRKRVDFESDEL